MTVRRTFGLLVQLIVILFFQHHSFDLNNQKYVIQKKNSKEKQINYLPPDTYPVIEKVAHRQTPKFITERRFSTNFDHTHLDLLVTSS